MSKKIFVSIVNNFSSHDLKLEGDIENVEHDIVLNFFENANRSLEKDCDSASPKKEDEKYVQTNKIYPKQHNVKTEDPKELASKEDLSKLVDHFKSGNHVQSKEADFKAYEKSVLENKHHVRVADNGERMFSTDYACPVCGNVGKRFSYVTNNYTKCHECDTKIRLTPATNEFLDVKQGGHPIPKPNDEGFFFEAFDLYE